MSRDDIEYGAKKATELCADKMLKMQAHITALEAELFDEKRLTEYLKDQLDELGWVDKRIGEEYG
jgi:hypothetical protein